MKRCLKKKGAINLFEALLAIFIMFILYICLAVLSVIIRVINSVSATQVPGKIFGFLGVLVMFYILFTVVLPLIF